MEAAQTSWVRAQGRRKSGCSACGLCVLGGGGGAAEAAWLECGQGATGWTGVSRPGAVLRGARRPGPVTAGSQWLSGAGTD